MLFELSLGCFVVGSLVTYIVMSFPLKMSCTTRRDNDPALFTPRPRREYNNDTCSFFCCDPWGKHE
jgi:hypothetical protein